MRRPRFERALFGAAAALSLSLGAPAMAADHRDAPTIDDYSAIDINDVYMFRNPANCNPGPGCNLVVALSTQAVADPQFGPSYHFQENALYRLNFTTRADAKPTAHIDFVFSPFGNLPDCPDPQIACQTFRAVFPKKVVIEGLTTQGTNGATHNAPVVTEAGGIKIFAGPRQDPFFFDLVGFNRSIAAGSQKFTGVDAFLDKNINAIVLEFPLSMVFPAGSCNLTPPFSTPCGTWAVTYLGHFNKDDLERLEPHPEGLRQVDRMGNPAVNTVLIPGPQKDDFNFGEPKDDPKDFAATILKQIINLDAKFKTCQNGNTTGASACGSTPLPQCATACNPNVPLLASVAVPDVLRFASNAPDQYPNGRRPQDRTTDLLLTLILQQPVNDGTKTKDPCPGFPFLKPPLQLGTSYPYDDIPSPYSDNPQSCP